MQVRVLPFGVLKDWLGASVSTVELPPGATVAELLKRLSERQPLLLLRGIAVSVNAEYAQASQVLREGDEVGLLPPVSGGSGGMERHGTLTTEPIRPELWIAAVKRAEDGAVVVFDGVVRNNSNGRQTLFLDYEAFHELAIKQMETLAGDAIQRFGIRDAWIVHRLGRLEIGETSVLIVVASAHRAQAFEACRWLIDTLKKTVPIWKKETFADGSVWAAGEPFPAAMAVSPPEAEHE
jgi:molybdopterin synthase catalytic subunit/molybdopterin converting factor small subunit